MSAQASRRVKKSVHLLWTWNFGYACDIFSEAYKFFNVKKLSLSSKGLNVRENKRKRQPCILEPRELTRLQLADLGEGIWRRKGGKGTCQGTDIQQLN